MCKGALQLLLLCFFFFLTLVSPRGRSFPNQITCCKPLSQWPTLSGVKARSTGSRLISATARCTGSNSAAHLLGSEHGLIPNGLEHERGSGGGS